MTEDFYTLLELSSDASQDEIKEAYREKVRVYHPDLNDDDRAQAQFVAVKKAYEILSDPVERQAYDRLGHKDYVAKRTSGIPSPDIWADDESSSGSSSPKTNADADADASASSSTGGRSTSSRRSSGSSGRSTGSSGGSTSSTGSTGSTGRSETRSSSASSRTSGSGTGTETGTETDTRTGTGSPSSDTTSTGTSNSSRGSRSNAGSGAGSGTSSNASSRTSSRTSSTTGTSSGRSTANTSSTGASSGGTGSTGNAGSQHRNSATSTRTAGSTGTAGSSGSSSNRGTSTSTNTNTSSSSAASSTTTEPTDSPSASRSRFHRLRNNAAARWWRRRRFGLTLIWLSVLVYVSGLGDFALGNRTELEALRADLVAVGLDPMALRTALSSSRYGIDTGTEFVARSELVTPPVESLQWYAALGGIVGVVVVSLLLVRVVWREETWKPVSIDETILLAVALAIPTTLIGGPLLAGAVLMPFLFTVIVAHTRRGPGWKPSYLYVLPVLAPLGGFAVGFAGYATLPVELVAFVVLPLAGAFGLPLRATIRKHFDR